MLNNCIIDSYNDNIGYINVKIESIGEVSGICMV